MSIKASNTLKSSLSRYFRHTADSKPVSESEFDKYRLVQDRLFESDFDRHIKKLLESQES